MDELYMKKKKFFSEVYHEFFYCISWPKWKTLQVTTIVIFSFSIFMSIFLYSVDRFFIFLIKKLFSL
ncbi:preprotein translocase subunit SecE [Blattabacterium cuenoti]|uniref:preprotein translocase subunit SecE n=1 Tax=Blattabacterium cuenoti TaxID=1653831 RepID=UPI00293BC6D2|nr:preprotein translocase subunit SecE [Blattabacterium cuenoti]